MSQPSWLGGARGCRIDLRDGRWFATSRDSRLLRKYHALMIFAICGRTPKSCPSRTKHALPDLVGEWRMSMLLFVATITLLSFGYFPALDE